MTGPKSPVNEWKARAWNLEAGLRLNCSSTHQMQGDFIPATHNFWQGSCTASSCHHLTLKGRSDLQGHLCRGGPWLRSYLTASQTGGLLHSEPSTGWGKNCNMFALHTTWCPWFVGCRNSHQCGGAGKRSEAWDCIVSVTSCPSWISLRMPSKPPQFFAEPGAPLSAPQGIYLSSFGFGLLIAQYQLQTLVGVALQFSRIPPYLLKCSGLPNKTLSSSPENFLKKFLILPHSHTYTPGTREPGTQRSADSL